MLLNKKKQIHTTLLLFAPFLLASCGQTGSLYLPTKSASAKPLILIKPYIGSKGILYANSLTKLNADLHSFIKYSKVNNRATQKN